MIDTRKELKNIFTDFVIKEFYVTSHQSDSMIKLIFEIHNKAIAYYIKGKGLKKNDIIFIYKGGNVLRAVAYETMWELPGFIAEKIKAYYQNYFKKSDNDFSIIINPHLSNFQEIYNDIKNLAFIVQNYLRNIYIADNTTYFDYYRLNDTEKVKILNKYVDKMNSSNTVTQKLHDFDGEFIGIVFGNNQYFTDKNFKPKTFDPQKDMEIGLISEEERTKEIKKGFTTNLVNLVELNVKDNIDVLSYDPYKFRDAIEFYISLNDSLTFGNVSSGKASFLLVRTKISVNAYFMNSDGKVKMIKLSGELIDVSVPNQLESSLVHFYDNLNEYVTTYSFLYGDKDINFKSYSIEYLTNDLEHILFDYSAVPWDDNKYQKRIKRLMYMYFILLLINPKYNIKIKHKYVSYINHTINTLQTNNLKLLNKFLQTTHDDTKKYPYRRILKNVSDLQNIPNLSNKDFAEYIELIKENLTLQLELLNDIDKYKKNDNIFTYKQIESITAMGGYHST